MISSSVVTWDVFLIFTGATYTACLFDLVSLMRDDKSCKEKKSAVTNSLKKMRILENFVFLYKTVTVYCQG